MPDLDSTCFFFTFSSIRIPHLDNGANVLLHIRTSHGQLSPNVQFSAIGAISICLNEANCTTSKLWVGVHGLIILRRLARNYICIMNFRTNLSLGDICLISFGVIAQDCNWPIEQSFKWYSSKYLATLCGISFPELQQT